MLWLLLFVGKQGDESELAKKVATLKWHGKELEMRNKNLVKSIREEENEIIQLKVKLKVLPLKQKLNVDEWYYYVVAALNIISQSGIN